jgi:hypothetical protein
MKNVRSAADIGKIRETKKKWNISTALTAQMVRGAWRRAEMYLRGVVTVWVVCRCELMFKSAYAPRWISLVPLRAHVHQQKWCQTNLSRMPNMKRDNRACRKIGQNLVQGTTVDLVSRPSGPLVAREPNPRTLPTN